MPSGKRIDWSQYDQLLELHLPVMTVVDWMKEYAPNISDKAIGARARKIGVKPSKYMPSQEHKNKISKTISKGTPDLIEKLTKLRDNHSLYELSSLLNISKANVHRLISKHNIILSDVGINRAKEASRKGSIGKTPWNKGKKLPPEMLVNMAIGRQKMSGRLSKLQSAFYRVLEENNITHFKEELPECRFGHWLFDCRIVHNNIDILVEVQGDYIHSLPKNISKDRAKATYMERYFPHIPIKYVWEHEFGAANRVKQKVRQWLNIEIIKQIDFDFSDVSIKEIDEELASEFLSAFHYLGKLAGRVKLGAYINETLVAVSIWSAPARNETATRLGYTARTCLELRRFVIHDSYHKPNFGSFLLSKMEKLLPPTIRMLVSFADPGIGHDGTIYKAANWKHDGDTEPSYFYADEDGYVMLKKTLYTLANKMHMREADYAETYNYEKIKTPPKLRFIKSH